MIKILSLFLCCSHFFPLFTNVSGKILELDGRFLTVQKDGLWLVMFYAPWCGHCQRLEPTWVDVGATLHEQKTGVHVAKLDATKYSSVASHFQVRGFPTILFFKQGQRIDFNGIRSKQSIISFVNRAKGPEVTVLTDQDSFLRTKKTYDVFFVYIGGEGTLKDMYFKVAKSLFTTIGLFSASKDVLPKDISIKSDATILVFKDEMHYEVPGTPPDDEFLRMWLRSEQFPSYSHLTGGSYHSLKETGRRFAISVTEKDDPLNKTMEKIALEKKHLYTFCWVEGNGVVNSMTFGTVSVPNVVVYDAESHEYFALNEEENSSPSITKARVEKFFEEIKAGNIASKGGSGMAEKVKRSLGNFVGFFVDLFVKNPVITSFVILIPTALISLFCICLCTIRDDDDAPGSGDEDSDFEEDESGRARFDEEGFHGARDQDEALDEASMEGVRQRIKDVTEEE